jgi:hypothetical protein
MALPINLLFVGLIFCGTFQDDLDPSMELLQKKMDVVREVMDTGSGYIDHDLYKRFWKGIPEEAEVRKSLIEGASLATLWAPKIQREIWRCTLSSYRARSVKRGRIKILQDEYIQLVKIQYASNPAVVGGIEKGMAKGQRSTEMILRGAAKREPVHIRGQLMLITEELCLTVLSGLEASVSRLELLFREEWIGTRKKFSYPGTGLVHIALYPFNRMQIPDTDDSWLLVRNINPKNQELITIVDGTKNLPKNSASSGLMEMSVENIRSYGGKREEIVQLQWKGSNALFWSGDANSPEGHLYIEMFAIYQPISGKFYLMESISTENQLFAEHNMQLLQQSIEFTGS